MNALHIDDFPDFFEAAWGFPPFPWQARLARTCFERGSFPAVLDLPTGSGKTAVIDVALFLLALDGGERFPRRVVLVVDRRVVVDQAYERARALAGKLEKAEAGVMSQVADRLRELGGSRIPVRAAWMRGGMVRDDAWARSPAQPVVAASTVDQVGSRLLFRGYGLSDGARPIHAGLLGNDTVFFLDEVHLSEPFRQTLESIRVRYRGNAGGLPDRWQVVEMSATPAQAVVQPFALAREDREHDVLRQRLEASKPARLLEPQANRRKLEAAATSAALELFDAHRRVIAVVVNRVDSARRIHVLLGRARVDGQPVDRLLLTGRSRPLDREALLAAHLERIQAGRVRSPGSRPLVVVATQCIEAGADFDFDGLVTECASLDALRQRFGRLDRLGALSGTGHPPAAVVLVEAKALAAPDPIYGDALGRTWRWLQERREDLDFGIDHLKLPQDPARLLAPRPEAPVLLPTYLDLWCQSRPRPHAEPDVALWLHGKQPSRPEVQVVWRAELSQELLASGDGGEQTAIAAVAACPPGSGEAVSVPVWAALAWLREARRVDPLSDVVVDRHEGDGEGEIRPAVAWRGDDSVVVRSAGEIRPGETLVVPCAYGGLAEGAWSPASKAPVRDLGNLVQLRQRLRVTVRLHPAFCEGEGPDHEGMLAGTPPSALPRRRGDDELVEDPRSDRERVVEFLEGLPAGVLPAELLAGPGSGLRLVEVPASDDGESAGSWWVVSRRLTKEREAPASDFDSSD